MKRTESSDLGVTIRRGPTAGTPAYEVPRDWWPDLMQWRRYTMHQQLPVQLRALLFYVSDAEATGDWLGYGSRDSYLRDGLGINPALVDWAIEGQRLYAAQQATPSGAGGTHQ